MSASESVKRLFGAILACVGLLVTLLSGACTVTGIATALRPGQLGLLMLVLPIGLPVVLAGLGMIAAGVAMCRSGSTVGAMTMLPPAWRRPNTVARIMVAIGAWLAFRSLFSGYILLFPIARRFGPAPPATYALVFDLLVQLALFLFGAALVVLGMIWIRRKD